MCLQFMIDNMILKDSNCLWPHSLKCMDCCLPNNLFCNCLLKTLTFTNDSRKGGGVNISCGLLTPSKCINKFLNPFVRVPLHTPLPYPLNDGLFLSIIERGGGEREKRPETMMHINPCGKRFVSQTNFKFTLYTNKKKCVCN